MFSVLRKPGQTNCLVKRKLSATLNMKELHLHDLSRTCHNKEEKVRPDFRAKYEWRKDRIEICPNKCSL